MKTLLTLTALAIGFTTASHAASGGQNFVRLDANGVSISMPGETKKDVTNANGCVRTDYSHSPRGFDYRMSVSECSVTPNSDYASIIETVQKNMKATRVLDGKAMTFNGVTGRFAHFENADGITFYYWIVTRGNKFYQVLALHEKGQTFNEDAKIMFESVRFVE